MIRAYAPLRFSSLTCLLDQDRAAGACWTFPWTEESSSVPRTASRSAIGTELTDKLTEMSSAGLVPWPRARRKVCEWFVFRASFVSASRKLWRSADGCEEG